MEHVVFFPAHDGSPAFRRTASLEEAVRLVEHLRNAEGVDHVSVYTLSEVPLAFKAYYRVEVPADEALEVPAEAAAAPQAEAAVAELAPAEDVAVEVPQVAADVPVVVPAQEPAVPAQPAPATLGFFARG